uniref:ATPase AAA-type core domain-containing protein n=1 Tax=Guillardia theta TaxID=55529 RepID=A0A7S4K007_GUITH|mmetsp:Transcript_19915/g.66334  ORF Transcript_19915/g.66334 Transcript_19915/m.66334 type:complete len:362 (+) Transcript_19915:236-1321(+)
MRQVKTLCLFLCLGLMCIVITEGIAATVGCQGFIDGKKNVVRQSSCLTLRGGSGAPWNVSDGGSPGAKELREKSMGNVNGMRMELTGHGSLEEQDEMYADEQLAVYSSRDARDKTERSKRPRTAEREGLGGYSLGAELHATMTRVNETVIEIAGVNAEIARVKEDIDVVNSKIEVADRNIIERNISNMNEQYWYQEKQLREMEKQQLREKEIQLLKILEIKQQRDIRHEKLADHLSKPEGSEILLFLNDLWNIARSGKTFSALEIIPLSTFLGGDEDFGNHLFIRECYLEMKRVIAEHFKVDPEMLKTLGPRKSCKPFILTGTPGIGKSCFAYYLLMELLRSKEKIVYQETMPSLISQKQL